MTVASLLHGQDVSAPVVVFQSLHDPLVQVERCISVMPAESQPLNACDTPSHCDEDQPVLDLEIERSLHENIHSTVRQLLSLPFKRSGYVPIIRNKFPQAPTPCFVPTANIEAFVTGPVNEDSNERSISVATVSDLRELSAFARVHYRAGLRTGPGFVEGWD